MSASRNAPDPHKIAMSKLGAHYEGTTVACGCDDCTLARAFLAQQPVIDAARAWAVADSGASGEDWSHACSDLLAALRALAAAPPEATE